MDRFYLLVPALILAAGFVLAFIVYGGMCLAGRPPHLVAIKHNQLLGPFFGGFIVWLIGPIERALIGRVAPNLITAISLLMCALTGVAAGVGQLAVALWLYVFAGILDILDGRLARLGGKQTAVGALFDSVSDRWGELFVFLGYAWYLHATPWLLPVICAFGASMMVSYTRARAESLGIELSGGMMQRAERILLVVVGTFTAVLYGVDAAVPIIGLTMLICAATSTATAISRWVAAFRILAKRADNVVVDQPLPVAPPLAPPLMSAPKVRPLEQH